MNHEGVIMKTLIIAEKPDMGRNIAAAIEPKAKNMRSYLEGDTYIISWAIGHLVGLAEPDAYDDRYKKWNISHLPIIPEQFKLIANKRTADQLKVIKELAQRCDHIVNACDAGREGQYIFSLIQRYLKLNHPVQRLWISDLTAETIRKGFQELRSESEYYNLTLAASARSEADWLIGMNGTRAFTTKHNELMSVGRVQTPVLALIYDREAEIAKFDSLTFFDVEAQFHQEETNYKGLWQGDRITEKEKADAIVSDVKGKRGVIESYEAKEIKEYPHRLYDLTLLQREANSKLNFSAKKTLDIAQSLYEKHKVITYPRTNSNYVTEQNIPEMHKALSALQNTSYGQWVQQSDRSLVHIGNKSICNPAKVEDHHAIMPTVRKATSLSADEQKLYDLVVRRFLSQFFPPARYTGHTVLTKVEKHLFKSNMKQLLELGWKVIYNDQNQEAATKRKKANADSDEQEEVTELDQPFELNADADVLCKTAIAREKATKPPKSYTEGTLLRAMESAGKQIEDDEMREAMKDSGLGTPATRASTIERLKTVGYITMVGKKITIANKGKIAIELIRGAGVELLTSPEMTGMWEKRLNDIARGNASNEQFMNNVKKFATMIVDKVRVQPMVAKSSFEKQEAATKRTRSTKKADADKTETKEVKPRTRKTAVKDPEATKTTRSQAASAASRSKAETSASQVNAIRQATITTRDKAASATSGLQLITSCPREGCGGQLFMGRKDYGCSHYRSGCSVIIRRDVFGHSITPHDLKTLIKSGSTPTLKLYTPGGEHVDGCIVLVNRNTGELSIDMKANGIDSND